MKGSLKNNNLYNDKELWDDADLDWYDYGFRNYDPQIGRFPQLDPLTDDYPELTNYQYASNDPILNIDLDGLEGVPTPGGIWNGSFLEQGAKLVPSLTRPIVVNSIRLGANIADRKANSNSIQNQIKSSYAIPLTGVGGAGALEGAGPFALLAGSYQLGWNYGETHADQITTWVTGTAAWFSKILNLEESTPIVTPIAHANRKDNPNEHIVYDLFGVTSSGGKVMLKYGISDYTRYKEKRPRGQTSLSYINRVLPSDLKGKYREVTYTARHFNNRLSALAEEIRLVTEYFFRNGKTPTLQKRSAPMSFQEWMSGTEY